MECEINWEKVTLDLLLIYKKDADKIPRRRLLETQAFHQNAFDIHHRYLAKRIMFHLSPEAKE